ncbi:MAG: AlwI family type II restriction endonuclease [Gammaproteobacteria bacterium]|nr:AlwI family type II restriction endonuclease [Gammaproteobacteria bacterium]MYK44147.1 AlwI family type II restriction endonuclease [Gammaproteobacteria bacterium]
MKPWSITTTIRNPYRLRDLLAVLKTMEGRVWNKFTQIELQVKLIQNRLYGYRNRQFYNGLSPSHVELIENDTEPLTLEEARNIFHAKNYEDPPMRGRQSVNPLKKFGFAIAERDRKIEVTELGTCFLREPVDLQDIFLRVFLKWQIPNPENNVTSARKFTTLNHLLGHFILLTA